MQDTKSISKIECSYHKGTIIDIFFFYCVTPRYDSTANFLSKVIFFLQIVQIHSTLSRMPGSNLYPSLFEVLESNPESPILVVYVFFESAHT